MDSVQELKPATARKVFFGQMAILAVLLAVIAVSNVFTTIADSAHGGVHLGADHLGVLERRLHLAAAARNGLVAQAVPAGPRRLAAQPPRAPHCDVAHGRLQHLPS